MSGSEAPWQHVEHSASGTASLNVHNANITPPAGNSTHRRLTVPSDVARRSAQLATVFAQNRSRMSQAACSETTWAARRQVLRTHPVTGPMLRRVTARWRELTGGPHVRDSARRTLLACSGGADSVALVLALCAGVSNAPARFVLGHVQHDVRPRPEALADRRSVEKLAASLGVTCVHACVRVRSQRGNTEANARRARYHALLAMAAANNCSAIAVAHHTDDAAETVLMRLLRGAGPARSQLCARVQRRGDGPPIAIIRPFLPDALSRVRGGLTRTDCELLCTVAGVAWQTDQTNHDHTRLRAALRATVMPALHAINPDASRQIVRSASLASAAGRLVTQHARRVLRAAQHRGTPRGACCMGRAELRRCSLLVRCEVLRLAHAQVARSRTDRLSSAVLCACAQTIGDHQGQLREIVLGGCVVRVTKDVATLSLRPSVPKPRPRARSR